MFGIGFIVSINCQLSARDARQPSLGEWERRDCHPESLLKAEEE